MVLQESPIFKNNFSEKLLQKCITIINEVICQPGQVIQDSGENTIYFLEKGKAEYFLTEQKGMSKKKASRRSLIRIAKKQSFGYHAFFTAQQQQLQIRTLSFTRFLTIRREDFVELLNEFPEDNETFCYIRDIVAHTQDYGKLGESCALCGQHNHHFSRCPMTTIVPDRYKVFKQSQILRAEREPHARSLQPKWKTFERMIDTVEAAINCFETNEEFILDRSWLLSDPNESDMSSDFYEYNSEEGEQPPGEQNDEIEQIEEEDELGRSSSVRSAGAKSADARSVGSQSDGAKSARPKSSLALKKTGTLQQKRSRSALSSHSSSSSHSHSQSHSHSKSKSKSKSSSSSKSKSSSSSPHSSSSSSSKSASLGSSPPRATPKAQKGGPARAQKSGESSPLRPK